MDYKQEQIATVHNLTDGSPEAPLAESAVVVPIAGDTIEAIQPTHIFETLERVGSGEVIVPLRAPERATVAFSQWVRSLDLPVTVLWCNSDLVEEVLGRYGLDGEVGKGRDVWLGLGVAANRAEYVAVHDADTVTYRDSHVPRLLAPLHSGYRFVKGYYARVEQRQLYGRLTRLFVAPLLRALSARHDEPILEYLSAFRYPLAGEFALTAETARKLRAQRAWGLEIGMLGETYDFAGKRGTVQVDLGIHRHDHRPVGGSNGLASMATQVGIALFRTLEDHGVEPTYDKLVDTYRDVGSELIEQYELDAALNGLSYDRASERDQVGAYAETIDQPGPDTRLPSWENTTLEPSKVVSASEAAMRTVNELSIE
ncbi:MAG: glycosyl transferase family 2 [Haloarculaceae archaeon]